MGYYNIASETGTWLDLHFHPPRFYMQDLYSGFALTCIREYCEALKNWGVKPSAPWSAVAADPPEISDGFLPFREPTGCFEFSFPVMSLS